VKTFPTAKVFIACSVLFLGCSSVNHFSQALSTPATTPTPAPPPTYKTVQILSDPPGARIEINSNYIGDAPITAKVKVRRDDVFVDWPTLIRAYPKGEGYPQQKYFAPGSYDGYKCPDRILFDTTRPGQ